MKLFVLIIYTLFFISTNKLSLNNNNSRNINLSISPKNNVTNPIADTEPITEDDINAHKLGLKMGFWSSFISSFGVICVSEIADKTFILLLFFSMKTSKIKLFIVASIALISMNIISVIIGYAIPVLLYKNLIDWLAIVSFIAFGIYLLSEAFEMSDKTVEDRYIKYIKKQRKLRKKDTFGNTSKAFYLNYKNTSEAGSSNSLNERLLESNKIGSISEKNLPKIDLRNRLSNITELVDLENETRYNEDFNLSQNDRIENSLNNFNEPVNNNKIPVAYYNAIEDNLTNNNNNNFEDDVKYQITKNDILIDEESQPKVLWAFFSTLIIAECGDRSQITTIFISAVYDFWGVLVGSSLAHVFCIIMAIFVGTIISKYLTEKQMNYFGGFIFLIFALQIILLKLNVI